MNTINHSEAAINVTPDGLTLWRIQGVPDTLYPTKMAAEVAARVRFPNEDPLARYGRISYTIVNTKEEGDITQETLAAAQLTFWPDSKLVSITEALRWIQEARMPTPYDEKEIVNYCAIFEGVVITPAKRREIKLEAIARNETMRERRATQVAQSVAVALANAVESDTPVQFYLCGLDAATGTYRYRGCRFGLKGSEYMSGFGFY